MGLKVALIDYGAGNLKSAAKALEHAASDRGISVTVNLVTDARDVSKADHVVLPGVGSFEHCITSLAALDDMIPMLKKAVFEDYKPFLGICVGMQLMASEGHEHGITEGLGWFQATCEKLAPSDPSLKIPHMGWNELTLSETGQKHPVFKGIESGDHVYFVHSYHMVTSESIIAATTEFGGNVTAAIVKDNIIGTQFHPEKSQKTGLSILGNFLSWTA